MRNGWAVLLACAGLLCVRGAAAEQVVLCFGDSITEGRAGGVAAGSGWVERLQSLSGGRLKCVNEGRGGRPASAVKEFAPALARTPAFDVLIVVLGTNDSRDDGKEGDKLAARVKANIAELVAQARAARPEVKVLLAAPYNINVAALKKNAERGPQREANLQAIGREIEALAKEQRTLFVNLYGVLPAETLRFDGVHPSADGHAKIAEAVWAALK